MCVCRCEHICTNTYGQQRSLSGVLLHHSPLCILRTEPTAHGLGKTRQPESPRDPPVSVFPGLGLQMYITAPGFLWLYGRHCTKHLLIPSSMAFFQKTNVRSIKNQSYLCSRQCLHFFSCASQEKTVLPWKPAPLVLPLSQCLPQWWSQGSRNLETGLLISAESVSIKNMH